MPFSYNEQKLTKYRNLILRLQHNEKRTAAKNINIIPLPIPLSDGNTLTALIYRPIEQNNNHRSYPTLLHIRGTGYIVSARYYAFITCSHLAEKSGCQVIDIDHRLAPEFPVPTGFADVYTAYQYIIDHAQLLQVDIQKIAVSGYSTGGNFAALAAIQAKKDKLPLALQILIAPLTDLSRSVRQFEHLENKDNFSNSLALWFVELYLQNKRHAQNPAVSPFWSKDLSELAPTYFLLGEFDRFRGDNEIYAQQLAQCGVWTHKSLFKNEDHNMFWANIYALETIAAQLKTAFGLNAMPKSIYPTFFKSTEDKIVNSSDLKKKETNDSTIFAPNKNGRQ
jgi:acetyl esterase